MAQTIPIHVTNPRSHVFLSMSQDVSPVIPIRSSVNKKIVEASVNLNQNHQVIIAWLFKTHVVKEAIQYAPTRMVTAISTSTTRKDKEELEIIRA
jgi:hypothetical protein